MADNNITLRPPSRWETVWITVALFSFFALFQAVNLYLGAGIDWQTNLTGDIPLPGPLMFWVFFGIYLLSLIFLGGRSIAAKFNNKTPNAYDWFVTFAGIVGLFLMVIATIYGVFKGEETIEFFFNIRYPLLLNISYAVEFISILWFAITD